MATTKPEFLDSFFDQIESQVQFGDSKASLLVAGDAILLAVSGDVIKVISRCSGNEFTVSCMVPSLGLGLATTAAALLMVSLVFALLAARPAKIHNQPPPELFLISHIAHMDRDAFAKVYTNASSDELIHEALGSIHGKAMYATQKFRLLRRAIDATLLSLGFTVASLVVALDARVLP